MGLDEHLIVYFTLNYKSRPEIEKRLIEFLASLKYFMDYWPRAKTYAQLAGFYHSEKSYHAANVRKSGASAKSKSTGEVSRTLAPMRVNDGRMEELELR